MPRPQVQALPTDVRSPLMLSGRGAAAAWPPPQQRCGDTGCLLPTRPAPPAGPDATALSTDQRWLRHPLYQTEKNDRNNILGQKQNKRCC